MTTWNGTHGPSIFPMHELRPGADRRALESSSAAGLARSTNGASRIVEAVEAGDSVVARVHQWGRGKGSGATVDDSHWQVWTVRDGKVVRVIIRADREAALEAAGLRE
jgi:ketosteroid isomerase-like protein